MSANAELLAPVLELHLSRYPLLQAEDLYKLVHQGVFGPGHIIRDPAAARQALAEELAGLRCCLQAAELTEPLDPGNRLIRVNLAPLRGRPDLVDRLYEVLLATAAEIVGSTELVARRTEEALGWCRERLPEQAGPLAGLAAESEPAGWPARHHSRVYVTAYRPAYRVVSAGRWRAVALAAIGPGAAGYSCSPPPADTTG